MRNGHYYDEGQDESSGWSAFIAGALIGGGVALLFAPKAGSELRGMLGDYANRAKDELVDKGHEAWNTAVDRGKEYYNKGEEFVRDAGRSAKEYAREGQETVKDAGRSAKHFAKQAQDVAREPGRSAL